MQASTLVLFYGTDAFLMDQAIAALVDETLPIEVRAYNYELVDGETAGVDQVISLAGTLPFAAERRVTVVRQPAFLQPQATKNNAKGVREAQERFLNYAAAPNPEHLLILRCANATSSAFLKKLIPLVDARRCERLQGDALARWAEAQAAPWQKSFSRDAVAFLEEMARLMSSGQLAMELEKAFLYYAEDHPQLRRDDLIEVFSPTQQHTIFNLLDAVTAGKAEPALRAWRDLCYLGEKPSSVLYRLTDALRTMLAVQSMVAEKRTQKDMAEQLKKHPFVIKKTANQVRALRSDVLVRALAFLLEQDIRLKSSSGISDEDLLEETILMLCLVLKK